MLAREKNILVDELGIQNVEWLFYNQIIYKDKDGNLFLFSTTINSHMNELTESIRL